MRRFSSLLILCSFVSAYAGGPNKPENKPNEVKIQDGKNYQKIVYHKNISLVGDRVSLMDLGQLEKRSFPEKYKDAPTVRSGSERFDFSRFAEADRIPVPVYEMSNAEIRDFHSSTSYLVQDMAIKLPRGSVVAIPEDLNQFSQVIKTVFQFEINENANLDEYYAYLTVDQREIKAGESLRTPGWHIDGMHVRAEGEPYERISRVYTAVVTDSGNNITEFTRQAFPQLVDMDFSKFNIFQAFEYLVQPSTVMSGKSGTLYYMDAYTVHRSPVAVDHTGKRTFLRVQLTPKVFDRKGNSVNPYFKDVFDFKTKSFPVLDDPNYLLKGQKFKSKL